MARIKLGNIDPRSIPVMRGGFYVSETLSGAVAKKWPKKRAKAKEGYDYYRQKEFGIAATMASNPISLDYQTAVEMVKGTEYVPRDWLMMCAYGKAYVIIGPDGYQWPRYRDVNPNPNQILDEVTDTHGSLLFRGEVLWEGLDPGIPGYVLTTTNTGPKWLPAGGTAGSGIKATTLYLNSNPALVTAFSWICSFDTVTLDDNGIWNPAFPDRLYIPTDCTKVRFSANYVLSNLLTAKHWHLTIRDSAGAVLTPGTMRDCRDSATFSANVPQGNGTGPWIPKPATEYVKLRMDAFANVTTNFQAGSAITMECIYD